MRIFLIGFMGCGKTHWGRLLSEKLTLPFFDLDSKVEEQDGRSVSQIFHEDSEERFRMLEKEMLHLLTESHDQFVMACGGGTPCFFNNIDYMKQKGVVVWINAAVDTIHQRLAGEKEQRPLISAIPPRELRSFIAKKYAARKIFYQQAAVILPDEQLSLEQLVRSIFHANT